MLTVAISSVEAPSLNSTVAVHSPLAFSANTPPSINAVCGKFIPIGVTKTPGASDWLFTENTGLGSVTNKPSGMLITLTSDNVILLSMSRIPVAKNIAGSGCVSSSVVSADNCGTNVGGSLTGVTTMTMSPIVATRPPLINRPLPTLNCAFTSAGR